MRRLMILGITLLCASPAALSAQLGLKGGLLWSDVSNSGLLPGELEGRTGFTIGLALDGGKAPLGLGVEALYARRGLESSSPADARKLNYIDVPVYLRVAFPTPGIQPFAYAGPQFSFEIACDTEEGDCPENDPGVGERPSTTFAALVGAGLRLGERSAFSVEARYMYGLTDLKLNTVTDSESYKDRVFLLLAGMSF
jgi:hypothetical protein